jgi:hypothetical protein
MKKPVFGPKRVGFLGTIVLTGTSGLGFQFSISSYK